MSTINFKAIRLLEVFLKLLVHLSVLLLGTTGGQEKNGDGDKYHLNQELSRTGEIPTTSLT